MTIQESTICGLVKSFPILLILAQNNNKCLKTPLIYKPPSPTPSTEYYEALDALFHSLFGHGYNGENHGFHGNDHGYHGCSGHGGYYGKKFSVGQTPCYTYAYPSGHGFSGHDYNSGHGHQTYGTTYGFPSIHGYSASPSYGYKKVSAYNLSGTHGYKGTYAPTQVYNMNHKYKVVVKRNKSKINWRKPQKLESFIDRENRRYPPQFGFNQNYVSNIRDRVTSVFQFRSQNRPNVITIPYNNRPVQNPSQYNYDEYGRPYPGSYREYEQPPVWGKEEQNPPREENPDRYNSGQNSGDNYPGVDVNVNFNPAQEGAYSEQGGTYPGQEGTYSGHNGMYPGPQDGNYVNFPNQGLPTGPPPESNTQTLSDVNFSENNPEQAPPEPEEPKELPTLTPAASIPELPPLIPVPTPEQTFTSAPEPSTELPQLTPVPSYENRNNFNFGPSGIFMEPCEVDGYRGSCIPILGCDPYVKMLQQSKTNPAVTQLLRRAHCGFEGNYPKVCCPLPGIPDQPPPTPTPAPTPSPTPAPTTTAMPQPETKSDQIDASDYVDSIPEPPVCGSSNATLSRVVGGVDAKLGDFPWMALLGYKKARGNTDWLCGGSLITSKHVLTASHCIHGHEKSLYVVRLGELDLSREDDGAAPVDVLIKKQIMHEEYSSNTFSNDIALLLLARDVQFTHLIKPICIPRSSELRANTFEDYTPLVAGWGSLEFRGPSAQILQALQLPVVSNEFCQNAYKAYAKHIIDDRVLCAGYKKGGKDACQGDSGGPLMQPIWNSQTFSTYIYQIGVVSFGKKCAEPGFPGVYSRITTFVPWLEKKLLGPAK